MTLFFSREIYRSFYAKGGIYYDISSIINSYIDSFGYYCYCSSYYWWGGIYSHIWGCNCMYIYTNLDN